MSHCCVSWGDYTVSGINHQRCNFIYYAYALNHLLGETSGKYSVVWRLSAGFEEQYYYFTRKVGEMKEF